MGQLKNVSFLLLFCFAITFAQASQAMDKVKKFLPTVTESAGLANAINVYMKVSDWVRSTNAVVSGMRGAIQDVRNAKSAVEDIITTAKAMKEFSIYDMDSWAMTVDNSKLIVGRHTNRILRSMGSFETHAIGGVANYIDAYGNISDFDIRDEKNKRRRLIVNEFSPESDESYLEGIFSEMKDGKDKQERLEAEKKKLEKEKAEVQKKYNDAISSNLKNELKDSLVLIDRRINRIEKKITIQKSIANGLSFTIKSDTIINDAKELMAVNLIEVETIYQMTGKINEQAAVVMNNINRLAGNKISGNVNTRETDPQKGEVTASIGDMDFSRTKKASGDEIYGDHPNQAKTPTANSTAKSYTFGAMDKAEVNTQDIIQTRNQINLILLKQEKLLRDIDVMKVNTFAYLMLIDGFNRSANLAVYDAVKVYARNYTTYSDSIHKLYPKSEALK